MASFAVLQDILAQRRRIAHETPARGVQAFEAEADMGKKSFRSQVQPSVPWRLGLLQRVLLLALIAQALTGCGKAREAVVEKAQRAEKWGTCIADNVPSPGDLAHPSQVYDVWSYCVDPPRITMGVVMGAAHRPPPAASGATESEE
jgi:hypothetical protein